MSARGFSLIEALFAVGLLASALIVLAQLAAKAVDATASVRFRSTAAVVAQNTVERLRGHATLATSSGVEWADGAGAAVCGWTRCDSAVFVVEWSVEPFVPLPSLMIARVSVTDARRPRGEVRAFALRRGTVR